MGPKQMKKTELAKASHKAKWEAPELVTLDADLTNVEAALNPGTDSLQFGTNLSMS